MKNGSVIPIRYPERPYSSYANGNCFIEKSHELRSSVPIRNFEQFVLQQGYPCIGARTALNSNMITYGLFDKMSCWRSPYELAGGLSKYLEYMKLKPSNFLTYVAIFRYEDSNTEEKFEQSFWRLLNQLHRLDARHYDWSGNVDSNPNSPNFSYSFGGEPFFIVGMHPNSSRRARRFTHTAIAFNLHSQFEELRRKGRYESIKSIVRDNDHKFDGSINPMLSDFGEGLEAPQYSGRKVEHDWKCPFKQVIK